MKTGLCMRATDPLFFFLFFSNHSFNLADRAYRHHDQQSVNNETEGKPALLDLTSPIVLRGTFTGPVGERDKGTSN